MTNSADPDQLASVCYVVFSKRRVKTLHYVKVGLTFHIHYMGVFPSAGFNYIILHMLSYIS